MQTVGPAGAGWPPVRSVGAAGVSGTGVLGRCRANARGNFVERTSAQKSGARTRALGVAGVVAGRVSPDAWKSTRLLEKLVTLITNSPSPPPIFATRELTTKVSGNPETDRLCPRSAAPCRGGIPAREKQARTISSPLGRTLRTERVSEPHHPLRDRVEDSVLPRHVGRSALARAGDTLSPVRPRGREGSPQHSHRPVDRRAGRRGSGRGSRSRREHRAPRRAARSDTRRRQ